MADGIGNGWNAADGQAIGDGGDCRAGVISRFIHSSPIDN